MTSPNSPSGELRVTPSHLRQLADKHGDTAAQIGLATNLVDDVAEAVLRTHGQVCSAAAAAADAPSPSPSPLSGSDGVELSSRSFGSGSGVRTAM